MADLATLHIKVEAREAIRQTEAFSRGAVEAEVATRRMSAAEREAQREAGKLAVSQRRASDEARRLAAEQGKLSTVLRSVNAAIATFVGSRIVREMIVMADTAKLLEGRLRLVTTGTENLTLIQDELRASAKRTRSAFEDTVTLYARVARSADLLGRTQADLLKFTELTQMAIKSSGATAQEASAGVVQLSQALASGALRGDEFRSVAEQMPSLARAIAQGMGVEGVGALRKLANEGELTADKVIAAVLSMDATIRGDFLTAPQLVAEAWVSLMDTVRDRLAEMDKGTGGSSKLATTLKGLELIATQAERTKEVLQRLEGGTVAPSFAAIAPTGGLRPGGHGGVMSEALAALDREVKAERDRIAAINDAAVARRKAWEDERTQTAEKKRWDDEALARATLISRELNRQNVLRAEAARAGRALRAYNLLLETPTLLGRGRDGSRTTSSPGDAVMNLPPGFGIGNSMTAMRSDDAAVRAVVAWRAEMSKANAEIGKNFRENIQRNVADFFSDFLTSGGSAIQSLFAGFKQIGADLIGQTLSKALMPKFDALGTGGALVAGLGLGVLGGVVSSFIDNAKKFRDEMRLAREAMVDWNRSISDWILDATMWDATPEERARRTTQQKADQFALDSWNIYRNAPGDFRAGLTGNADADRARIKRDLDAAGGNWDALFGWGDTPVTALKAYYEALLRVQEATVAQTNASNEQAEAAKAAAAAMAEASRLAAARQRIASYAQTIEGLQGFKTSLGLSGLSTMNPQQQLALAKAEYDKVFAKAMGGDQSAAGQLPEAARAFLERSRDVNASGGRYAVDFNRVNADTDLVLSMFAGRKTAEERMLGAAEETNRQMDEQTDVLQQQHETQQDTLTVLRGAFPILIDSLGVIADRLTMVERYTRGTEEALVS